MPGGRPSLFEQCAPKFLAEIENALPVKAAAARAGVDDNTVMRWLAAGREQKSAKFINFFKQYTRARGIAQAKVVERVRTLGREDWRRKASSWSGCSRKISLSLRSNSTCKTIPKLISRVSL
jgi:hypothetical protein